MARLTTSDIDVALFDIYHRLGAAQRQLLVSHIGSIAGIYHHIRQFQIGKAGSADRHFIGADRKGAEGKHSAGITHRILRDVSRGFDCCDLSVGDDCSLWVKHRAGDIAGHNALAKA